jgi:hypothetical protein
MMTDAIQSILSTIVNSYAVIVESDDIPSGTFAVHQEDLSASLRDKEGVFGYIYNVAITVVSESPDDIDTKIAAIITAMIAASGTVSSTTIEEVLFSSSEGKAWDDEKKRYYDLITFSVETKNL